MKRRRTHNEREPGFTLLELGIVIFLIAIISAVAFPQLLPAIAFSQLEGQARHLANYGRSVVAQATMLRQDLTIYFDLDQQEYYTIRLEYPETAEGETEAEAPDQLAMLEEMRGSGMSPGDLGAMLSESRMSGTALKGLPDGFSDEAVNQQLGDKFNRFARKALEARAKNVKQEAGFLDEIGPLFDPEDKFSLDEIEPTLVEITDPVLARTRMGDNVRLETVVIEGSAYSRGVAELKLTSLGLTDKVWFYLVNDDREYYTVVWDPVTGGANVYRGRQEAV
jgi:competence protein ComGC